MNRGRERNRRHRPEYSTAAHQFQNDAKLERAYLYCSSQACQPRASLRLAPPDTSHRHLQSPSHQHKDYGIVDSRTEQEHRKARHGTRVTTHSCYRIDWLVQMTALCRFCPQTFFSSAELEALRRVVFGCHSPVRKRLLSVHCCRPQESGEWQLWVVSHRSSGNTAACARNARCRPIPVLRGRPANGRLILQAVI